MAAFFWDLDYATTPPQTPPLHFSSEIRHTSPVSFYDRSHCSSPMQESLDWPSSEQVEFTRLNPSRTKDNTEGEWHMVTATRSLLGRERRGQREGLQDQLKVAYNSLPRAHFLQPNRESSAFSPYANDFCLNGKDAKNIAESPRNSRKLHPLTQPGFYSPKIPRSKHCEAAQSTKKSLKGSSSTNNLKEFFALTLPLPCTKTAVLKPSPAKPDCSPNQMKTKYTQHRENGDVRNTEHNQVKSQVDENSKNVFGQPRVIASLRAACSPRPVRKSTVVEDLKKLIVMDDTEDSAQGDSSSPEQYEAGLCSSLHMSGSSASPSLFSQAHRSNPESPPLTPIHLHLQAYQTECGGLAEQAESDLWDRDQHPDPELMPLPSAACDLDWNSLVQAAQEYETQRMATLLSEMSPGSSRPDTPSHGTYKIHQSSACCSGVDIDSDTFIDFPDQLSHLEGMLRRLSTDLLKEKRDKVALLAEVLKLRVSNQHLREESVCAVAQLHKISKILNTTPGEMD
ncbi:hypothetical protein QQF64_017728 [Cirrhinus molitorella]|uniref:Signal-induced proliferation-associated 1-like protein C-terminal domain-containing protein n=1 Tax=Cirrhinus molitorella TaxID=172907 RepID=A0ABR3LKW7_9TELE